MPAGEKAPSPPEDDLVDMNEISERELNILKKFARNKKEAIDARKSVEAEVNAKKAEKAAREKAAAEAKAAEEPPIDMSEISPTEMGILKKFARRKKEALDAKASVAAEVAKKKAEKAAREKAAADAKATADEEGGADEDEELINMDQLSERELAQKAQIDAQHEIAKKKKQHVDRESRAIEEEEALDAKEIARNAERPSVVAMGQEIRNLTVEPRIQLNSITMPKPEHPVERRPTKQMFCEKPPVIIESPKNKEVFQGSRKAETRGASLWGTLRAARKEMSQIDVDLDVPETSDCGLSREESIQDLRRNSASQKDLPAGGESPQDSRNRVIAMARLLKMEQVEMQTKEMTNFIKDNLDPDREVRNNPLAHALKKRGLLSRSRAAVGQVDPESHGMLACHDHLLARFLFYCIMVMSGMVARIYTTLPLSGSYVATVVAVLVAVCEFFGSLYGGFYADLYGRRRAVSVGAMFCIFGAGMTAVSIWLDESLWHENEVVHPLSFIACGLFLTAGGCAIMIPAAMVLAAECTASCTREYILTVGFFMQAAGATGLETVFYIIGYFDLTDSDTKFMNPTKAAITKAAKSLRGDAAKSAVAAVRRLGADAGGIKVNAMVLSKEGLNYTNVWPLICMSTAVVCLLGFTIVMISYWHPNSQESYIWKNKAMWLHVTDKDMKRMAQETQKLNNDKRKYAKELEKKSIQINEEPKEKKEGSDEESEEKKEEDSESEEFSDVDKSYSYDEYYYSEYSDLEEPLLGSKRRSKRIKAAYERVKSWWYNLRMNRSFRKTKQQLKMFFKGLVEYGWMSGSVVRLEILTLVMIPMILSALSFSTSKFSDLFLNLPPVELNLFPVRLFHYQMLLGYLSIPAFLASAMTLMYYTPKLLQLLAFISSAFIYSGLALSLFGIDGAQLKDTSGHLIHLEDFYYSALSYDYIFQLGLYIPMVTAFIIPIQGSHTRVRGTILAFCLAASKIGQIMGVLVASMMKHKTMGVSRVSVLLAVCGLCLLMAYLTQQLIPSQHVAKYDMPELHTIDLCLDKRFPERKSQLKKEQKKKKELDAQKISGLHKLNEHSMASKLHH